MSEQNDKCVFVSAAGIRCHRAKGHDGGHKPYPIDWDLPADLAEVLADQSIVIPQDAAVWSLREMDDEHELTVWFADNIDLNATAPPPLGW